MKGLGRLDVQLTLIFVAILSLTVSLTGWIHRRGHLINLVGPFFELEDHLQSLEPRIRSFEAGQTDQTLQALLGDFPDTVLDLMYLVVDDAYHVLAHTTPRNSLIELVRRESDPRFFVVETSSIDEKFDYILIYQMVPALAFTTPGGEARYLLAVPKPRLIDAPPMKPILLVGLRYHFHIFGWFYGAVVLFFVLFIRWRLRPLRKIESASRRLTQREIPGPIVAKTRKDEVGQLVVAFNHALEKLGQQEQTRKRMVADIAHELRTPLTNLSGRIEAYEDKIINNAEELIAFTANQVANLSRIVEDLNLLSQVDAGELPMIPEEIEVKTTLTTWLNEHQIGGRYTWQIHGEPVMLFADPHRFKQVVTNLIANAIQAKTEGLQITLFIHHEPERIVIRFQDNGPGVSQNHLPHLFERLYRADHSRNAQTGGSGLGLSIVKTLVEAHGGAVKPYSVPSGGLGIELNFPRKSSNS